MHLDGDTEFKLITEKETGETSLKLLREDKITLTALASPQKKIKKNSFYNSVIVL